MRSHILILSFLFSTVICCKIATAQNADVSSFDNASNSLINEQVIAFVGHKVFITPYQKEDSKSAKEARKKYYKARYKILELLEGQYEDKTIDFIGYTYGADGMPYFAEHDTTVLFIKDSNSGLIRNRFTSSYHVNETQSGKWAYCGNAYRRIEHIEMYDFTIKPLEPLSFKNSEKIDVDAKIKKLELDYNLFLKTHGKTPADREEILSQLKREKDFIQTRYQDPIYTRTGDTAICKSGVYADEIYRLENEINIKPRRRKEICSKRVMNKHFYTPEEFRGKLYYQYHDAIKTCEAELKKTTIP